MPQDEREKLMEIIDDSCALDNFVSRVYQPNVFGALADYLLKFYTSKNENHI